jgi:hypothetical protein
MENNNRNNNRNNNIFNKRIEYVSTLADSHGEFGSTFEERQEENEYFDAINAYRKQHQHNFSRQIYNFPKDEYNKYIFLQQSRGHFTFPDRKPKSFDQLDREYYSKTQMPDQRFENLAGQKYKNVYTMYNLPYQFIKNQSTDDTIQYNNKNIQYYTADKPAGPINENWVVDDSQERMAVGEKPRNDAYRLKIDGSLIDEAAKRTGVVFKNYA